jgi:hypothetical protein
MGLLSTLAKLGGVAAAPFTGGASLALSALGTAGDIAGNVARSRAQGRADEADVLTRRDREVTSRYGTAQGAEMQKAQVDLARKGFEEAARGGRAKQAALADMLAGFEPTRISVPGIQTANVTGGLRVGDGARAALGQLHQQALMKQLAGDTFEGGTMLTPPPMSELPKAGKLDSILNTLGIIGSIGGAVGGMLPPSMAKAPSPSFPIASGVPGGLPGGVDLDELINESRYGVR